MSVFRPDDVLAGFHAVFPDGDDSGLVHAGEQWVPTSLVIGEHAHRVWELYLQTRGASHWRVGTGEYRLAAGHFLAVPPSAAHTMVGRPSASHHFVYAGVELAAVWRRHPVLAGPWTPPRPLHLPAAESLQAPFRQLVREAGMRLPYRLEGIVAAVDHLVVAATRLISSSPTGTPIVAVHPAVQTARKLLDEHYDRPMPLADLAGATGLSANYLVELFTREVGLPPHRYLLERRIDRAKELLDHADLPITRIAHELGYASGQHFARSFRQGVGCSPSEFRRRFSTEPSTEPRLAQPQAGDHQ